LVAAVYGTNLELVRYVKGKLKGEAAKQWAEVDIKKVEKQMPTPLSPNATYRELGEWYTKHSGAVWCRSYDERCVRQENCDKWAVDRWEVRGDMYKKELEKTMDMRTWWRSVLGYSYYAGPNKTRTADKIVAPATMVHDNVVKAIMEQLDELVFFCTFYQ